MTMVTLTTGERLDDEGSPVPGTGFEYDSEGEVAKLLAQRISPVLYSPSQGEWAWMVPDDSDGKFERIIAVCSTGNNGPILHYHPTFDEHFKPASGSFVLKADGEEVTLHAGQELMVKRGTMHTFRCIGEDGDFGVMVADVIPPVGFVDMIKLMMGLAQEGKITSTGDPKLLQLMVSMRGWKSSLGNKLIDLAVPKSPGKSVITILSSILAPLGRLLGYKVDYPHYYEDEFWEKRVNQPPN